MTASTSTNRSKGMLVTIEQPLVVSNTNSFGETYVVASGGAGATGVDARGGITLSPGDYNPERIQIDESARSTRPITPTTARATPVRRHRHQSATASTATRCWSPPIVTIDQRRHPRAQETTGLAGDRDHLTDRQLQCRESRPGDGPAKFNMLAAQHRLQSRRAGHHRACRRSRTPTAPATACSDLSGAVTAQAADRRDRRDRRPALCLYRDRADRRRTRPAASRAAISATAISTTSTGSPMSTGSAHLIEDPAYQRQPQAAGRRLRLQRPDRRADQRPLHLARSAATRCGAPTSRRATRATPRAPPRADGGRRLCQQRAGDRSVSCTSACSAISTASISRGAVGSDRGERADRPPPAQSRPRSATPTMFDGNAQAIDHQIVSGGLLRRRAVRRRSISTPSSHNPSRPTDHDPTVGRFFIEHPNEAPTDLALDQLGRRECAGGDARRHGQRRRSRQRHADLYPGRRCRRPVRARSRHRRADHHRRVRLRGDVRASASPSAPPIPTASASTGPSRSPSTTSTRRRPTSPSTMRRSTRMRRPERWSATVSAERSRRRHADLHAASTMPAAASRSTLDRRADHHRRVRLRGGAGLQRHRPRRPTPTASASTGPSRSPSTTSTRRRPRMAMRSRSTRTRPRANLWTTLLANDSDPDAGNTLSILSVDTTGTQGHVLFDAGTQSLRYVADADAFDALATGRHRGRPFHLHRDRRPRPHQHRDGRR